LTRYASKDFRARRRIATTTLERGAGRRLVQQFGDRRQADNREALGFQRCATTLFTIDQGQNSRHGGAGALNRFCGAQRRSPRGNDVFDDHNAISVAHRSLDESAGAVLFRFLTYGEGAHERRLLHARHSDRVRNRIRTERQTPNGIRDPSLLTNRGERQRSDDREAFRAHCRQPRIHVVR
jgi:hypothetical protein